MPRIVIVGDQGSGKTTFLALLYAAQVKSGSDAADDFRFHVTFDSLDEITNIFQQLMSGSFPDSAAKEGIHEISFRLGYGRPRLRILSRLRSRQRPLGDSASFHFILLRNLADEISRFRSGSSVANWNLRDVLESDAIAILVDSGKLAVGAENPRLGSMENYDAAVESLLSTIQRSRTQGGRDLLYPIFIFSKFDSVKPEALRAANVEGTPPGVRETGPRTAYARALLDSNLPKTMATIGSRDPRGRKFPKPSFFFSWVHTESAGPGRAERIRLRRSGAAGWELDYSKDEYLAFVECLRKFAPHAEE